jgi:hypothetical protein
MKHWASLLTWIFAILATCVPGNAQIDQLWIKAETAVQSTNLSGISLSNSKIAFGAFEN